MQEINNQTDIRNAGKSIVVYNLAAADSVIAAALLLEPGMKAMPASTKVAPEADVYNWVGVLPAQDTLTRVFKGVNQGFMASCPGKPYNQKMRIFTPDNFSFVPGDEFYNDLPVMTDSVFKAVSGYTGKLNLFIHNEQIQRFIAGDASLTLDEQVWVWKTYYHALSVLNQHATGGDAEFNINLTVEEKDKTQYLSQMKEIKRQVTRLFEYTTFKLDGRLYRVPLINVNQDLTPWVLRLLSATYDFAVTYEQQREMNVYTVFSRIAGFDECIIRQISDGKNSTFSHWL